METKTDIKKIEEIKKVEQPKVDLEKLGQQIGQVKIQLFDLNNEIKGKQSVYNQGMQQLQGMMEQYNKIKGEK